jgi:ParB-like chromosome segregation protein Spo0J
MTTIDREFKRVPARKIRFSTILPRRHSYDDEILASMKRNGVQQPPIVRPLLDNLEEYEIIDGNIRRWAFEADDLVLVDVRYGVKDSEAFKISEMTFKRKGRTTRERAEFIAAWLEAVRREHRKRGTQAKVAKDANLSEGEVSQYLAIHKTFQKLERLPGSQAINFDALKNQSINKLYELSKLTEDPTALLQIAEQLAERPDMPVRELRCLVEKKRRSLFDISADEPYNSEKPEVDLAKFAELLHETLNVAEETRKGLEDFGSRMTLKPERFLKSEILKELQKLQRRFRRLQKDVAKLPRRGFAKVV